MEFLEKLGDYLNMITAYLERAIRRMFGSSNEREVRNIGFLRDKNGESSIVPGSALDRIEQLEPEYEKLSDGELKQCSEKFRAQLADGKTLDDILPDAFAAVRESGKRYLKMRHYPVQMVGGYILHKGKIAEMVTGEGKTLVATLPSYLNALAGSVHVVTVNDYLALRDMEWMGPVHMGLGLTVGAIQSQMSPKVRQKHYDCDITYGTNNEFGFDYLRDNMKPTRDLQVQGDLNYAIVDEIDNILIDEARTPLIISGPAHDDITRYSRVHRVATQLKRDEHFEVKEKEHTCHLTEDGIRKAEELAGVDSFYTSGNMEWPHLLDNSLKALYLYKKDVHYMVRGGEVIIIDEQTGRAMEGRQWSDGLHQAVEAKEGVRIKESTQTLATITLQNYFRLYNKLCGMTGTAMTEANEFWKIYKLDVVAVPTNRPMQRLNHPDAIFRSQDEKWEAVVQEIREVNGSGRPVLVGTVSVENSEILSRKLNKYGIKHEVLNAKFPEREAEIVSQAGREGAVTVSTNMAGRGTDIILGGNPEHAAWEDLKSKYESRLDIPKAEWDEYTKAISEQQGMKEEGKKIRDAGGLYVIGTERHDSRRIDLQLRGRAGRQGDPGDSRFFISMEDDLMRIFAGEWVRNFLMNNVMQEGEPIESGMVTRSIEKAQKRREEHHFEQRKHLLDYDEVMDEQRKRVYSYRQRILDGGNCRGLILEMVDRQLDHMAHHFLSSTYRWETVAAWVGQAYGIDTAASELAGMNRDQMEEFLRGSAERQAEDHIMEQIDENLPEDVENKRDWNWLALSRWANGRFGLNTSDRELKEKGRENVQAYLAERTRTAIEKFDFSPLDQYLSGDWGRESLAGWLEHQYGLQVTAEELQQEDPNESVEYVRGKILDLYRDQEIQFPVAVGMTKFMGEGQRGVAADKEGLATWANNRFKADLQPGEVKEKSKNDIESLLKQRSESFFQRDQIIDEMDDLLDETYRSTNGQPLNGESHSGSLPKLVDWANTQFETELKVEEFEHLDREAARQRVLQAYDSRYRPEFSQTERSLILEVLDTAWKEHLYYMDHLRSGIGLVGYAQKDPKVEYKREGMKAFEQMWDGIGERVTGAIFRVEKQSPEYVSSLWEISATTHAEPEPDAYVPKEAAAEQGGPQPGGEQKAIDPIVNRQVKIGRNDPCPCGSGKKYKKCCGK